MWLLVQESDVPRAAQLMGRFITAEPEDAEAEPPCPCCGTAAPLVAGACSDCGLQLA